MGKRKTPEERADEARRYELAKEARTDEDFEPLFDDPNQAIRAAAAFNPNASAAVLRRFASDKFWGTRMSVIEHRNTDTATLISMLDEQPNKRGIVHSAARQRLEQEGVAFDDTGMPATQA